MQARRFTSIRTARQDARRGTFAPAAIVALVVVVSGVALVLDKLWLDAAQLELNTAVESAALASGRSLASDDLLRLQVDMTAKLEQTRQFAVEVASKNLIAGSSVQLDASAEGNIRFGKLVYRDDLNETVFVETDQNPTSAVVFGERSHTQSNPVALFWQGITGQSYGNVSARAEASVDNHIAALRPLDGVPIPVLPIAIMKNPKSQDSDDAATHSWMIQIEQRQGPDQWAVDPETHRAIQSLDGIPEMKLRTQGRDGSTRGVNLYLFALDRQSTLPEIEQHFQRGWTIADFKSTQPELRLNQGPLSFQSLDASGGDVGALLQPHIGECRIVFLYEQCEANQLVCTGVVAGRIMSLQPAGDGAVEIMFQPGVLTTRTAVLVNEAVVPMTQPASENKYVYKLQLTF